MTSNGEDCSIEDDEDEYDCVECGGPVGLFAVCDMCEYCEEALLAASDTTDVYKDDDDEL